MNLRLLLTVQNKRTAEVPNSSTYSDQHGPRIWYKVFYWNNRGANSHIIPVPSTCERPFRTGWSQQGRALRWEDLYAVAAPGHAGPVPSRRCVSDAVNAADDASCEREDRRGRTRCQTASRRTCPRQMYRRRPMASVVMCLPLPDLHRSTQTAGPDTAIIIIFYSYTRYMHTKI